MNKLVRTYCFVLFLLFEVGSAEALVATKASQLVDLSGSFSDSCSGISGGIQAVSVGLPDGTVKPFVIPNKKVLVVNSIEVLVFGADVSSNIQSRLFKGKALNWFEVSIQEKLSDSTGRAQFNYVFPAGVVVASGGNICANSNVGTNGSIFIHGFLAPAN